MNKKFLVTGLMLSTSTLILAACGSGGSSSSTVPPATTAVTVTPPPPSYVPVGSPSAPTPVAINIGAGSIALPITSGGSTSYATYAMPADVVAALSVPGVLNTLIVTSNGNNVILTIPGTPQITYLLLLPPPSTQAAALQDIITLDAESFTTTGATTNIIEVSRSANFTIPHGVFLGNGASITVVTPNGSGIPSISWPLSSCKVTGQITGSASAVEVAIYNNITYLGVGTTTGTACVLSGADAHSSLTNLSSQAPQNRYIRGSVQILGFTTANNVLYGYWGENVNNVPTIYRVTANSDIVATSFWNVTTTLAQISGSGSTLTITNPPPSISSMYADSSNNLYVGTANGSVYKLANGFTSYTATQLVNPVGVAATDVVTVAPTTSGVGTTATTIINGTVTVFAVN